MKVISPISAQQINFKTYSYAMSCNFRTSRMCDSYRDAKFHWSECGAIFLVMIANYYLNLNLLTNAEQPGEITSVALKANVTPR